MGRDQKYDWYKLYLEFKQDNYRNIREFAEARGLSYDLTRKAFKKIDAQPPPDKNRTKKSDKKSGQNVLPSQPHETDELTPKQRRFVQEYLVDLNATAAAIRAGYSKKTAAEIGHQQLQKSTVKKAIDEAMDRRALRTGITADLVLMMYYKIATADIRSVVEWGPKGIKLRPSSEVDGTILAEVSEVVIKGGKSRTVKLCDRMKALDALAKHLNLFSDRHRQKIEEARLEIERERLKLEKAKVMGEPDETHDDGLIEALSEKAGEAWNGHAEED